MMHQERKNFKNKKPYVTLHIIKFNTCMVYMYMYILRTKPSGRGWKTDEAKLQIWSVYNAQIQGTCKLQQHHSLNCQKEAIFDFWDVCKSIQQDETWIIYKSMGGAISSSKYNWLWKINQTVKNQVLTKMQSVCQSPRIAKVFYQQKKEEIFCREIKLINTIGLASA